MSEKNEGLLGIAIIGLFMGGMVVIAIVAGTYSFLTAEDAIIEGEVVGYELDGKSYMNVTFDNGETYRILIDEDYYDFTVNSKIILYLRSGGLDDYWEIVKMVKMPSEEH